MREKITARQAGILASFLIVANKLIFFPSLVFKDVQSDSIFIVLIWFLVELFALWVLIKLKEKHKSLTLMEIFQKYLGKWIPKIIIFVFMIYFLLLSVLLGNEVYLYLRNNVYEESTLIFFLICLLPVTNYAVSAGLQGMSRTAEFFYKFFMFGLIACIGLSVFNFDGLPSFFNAPAGDFFLSFFRHFFWFLDFMSLFVIIDKITYSKNMKRTLFSYSIITMIIYLIFFFMFISIYRVTAFMHGSAISDLIMFSSQYGGIGRIDIIAILTIMLGLFFQFEIYLYCFCDCFQNVFRLSRLYALSVFDFSYLLLQYAFINNLETMINIAQNGLQFYSLIVFLIIPVNLFCYYLIYKLKDKRRNRFSVKAIKTN